jgi:hypothetical protein
MRKVFLRWSEGYAETCRQTRFLTQFFCFCVALILIFGVVESAGYIISHQNEISPRLWQNLTRELSVQVFVAALFAVRFFLLFFRDKKYFWLSQFIWVFTYLTLISKLSGTGCTKNAFPMFGENFSYVFVAYLFFSPLRQLLTLLVSFSRISIK